MAATKLSKNGNKVLIDRESMTGKFVVNFLAFLPAILLAAIAGPLWAYSSQQSRRAEYYAAVVENLAKPIVVVDPEGIIILANVATHQLFGCEHEPGCLEGRHIQEFVAIEDIRKFVRIDQGLADLPDQDFTLPLRRETGEKFTADIGVRQLEGLNGYPVFVAVLLPHSAELLGEMGLPAPPSPPPSPEAASPAVQYRKTYRVTPTRSFINPPQVQVKRAAHAKPN